METPTRNFLRFFIVISLGEYSYHCSMPVLYAQKHAIINVNITNLLRLRHYGNLCRTLWLERGYTCEHIYYDNIAFFALDITQFSFDLDDCFYTASPTPNSKGYD